MVPMAQPTMPVAPVPTQLQMGPGERAAGSQEGHTALKDIHNIQIVYNAEVRELDCCPAWSLCCATCGLVVYNQARSYLYVRENSIESNFAMKLRLDPCQCTCNSDFDATRVLYFDNDPFKKESRLCGLLPIEPKLEVVDTGFMILCMKCCSDEKVVLMPWETCCCGCVSNRVGSCDNLFGLFGYGDTTLCFPYSIYNFVLNSRTLTFFHQAHHRQPQILHSLLPPAHECEGLCSSSAGGTSSSGRQNAAQISFRGPKEPAESPIYIQLELVLSMVLSHSTYGG